MHMYTYLHSFIIYKTCRCKNCSAQLFGIDKTSFTLRQSIGKRRLQSKQGLRRLPVHPTAAITLTPQASAQWPH